MHTKLAVTVRQERKEVKKTIEDDKHVSVVVVI